MRDGALLVGLVVGGGLLYMASRGRAIAGSAGGTKATNAAYTILAARQGALLCPEEARPEGADFKTPTTPPLARPADRAAGRGNYRRTPGGKGYRAAN